MKTIIEQTPITLPNDYADTVSALIYAEGDYPKLNYRVAFGDIPARLQDDYSQSDIEKLWADQYPEWNETIFTNN
jgi:hypothetical protein